MHSCVIVVLVLAVATLAVSLETYLPVGDGDLKSACKWSEEHKACSGYCSSVQSCIEYEAG
ncbi:hypothetical protein KIPB_013595, partial [Kipferlia bialata]|eukprot:g13595.t1